MIPFKSRSSTTLGLLTAVFLAAACVFPLPARAHTLQDEALPNIGVDEKPGVQVPLDLTFVDQAGKRAQLADYLTGGPVVLTLNYYACPTLCPVVLKSLAATATAVKGLSLGKDYRIVTVSIDPDEMPDRARARAAETWRMVPQVAAPEKNWPFLYGHEGEIARLAKTVGVRYVRLEKSNFAHPSVMVVLTPAGKVARYLYGVEQRPADFKLALVEAADGRIGGSTLLNQVLLYCYHYDPVGKKYALAAVNVMKIGGGFVLLFLGILLLALWGRGKRGVAAKREEAGE
jgi:protein SCO1/2